mmetsp:Transcript_27299/g.57194  ORF Transcript_27299/g.57194 Transcript_27299/m.57194 type:complete len:202 (-) Transcript_27299:1562-2167(-)
MASRSSSAASLPPESESLPAPPNFSPVSRSSNSPYPGSLSLSAFQFPVTNLSLMDSSKQSSPSSNHGCTSKSETTPTLAAREESFSSSMEGRSEPDDEDFPEIPALRFLGFFNLKNSSSSPDDSASDTSSSSLTMVDLPDFPYTSSCRFTEADWRSKKDIFARSAIPDFQDSLPAAFSSVSFPTSSSSSDSESESSSSEDP